MKIKKILIITLTLILIATSVQATNIQSKPGVPALVGKNASEFFQLIRDAEKQGGALGLNATFAEQDNAYVEISTSNNIDSHMMKNTEWGAVTMLSMSSYGTGEGKIKDIIDSTTYIYDVTASTTGNMTGVFGLKAGLSSYEALAACNRNAAKEYNSKYLKYSKNRYADNYLGSVVEENYIPGDVMYEVKDFPGVGSLTFVGDATPIFIRGLYSPYFTQGWPGNGAPNIGSRLVIWNVQGI